MNKLFFYWHFSSPSTILSTFFKILCFSFYASPYVFVIYVYVFACAHVHVFASFIHLSLSVQLLPLEPFACVCFTLRVCAHQPAAPFAPAGGGTCLAAGAYSCSSSDAIVWFKEPEGGRPSSWTESENYYPSYKDGLHCCSTGTPLCSRSVTQCLLTNPQCKSSQSTSSRPCVVVLWKLPASKNACLLPFRYLVMADWDEGEVVTTQTITKHGNAVVSPVAFGMPLQ